MKTGIKRLRVLIGFCIYTAIGLAQNDSIIFSITKPLCYGNCNGSIVASVTGTNAPYSFLWSNGATTNSITGLCANDYTLSITNSNSVTTTSTVILGQPQPLVVNLTYCGLPCYAWANNTTSVCINPYGGTLPYTYKALDINSVPADSGTINNNSYTYCFSWIQGVYNIIMKDSNNCQASLYGNYIILDSTNCYTTFSSPTCSTCCDGTVQLNFVNPCPSCITTLSQAGTTYTSSTNTFTNVCLGSYTISATNFGCTSIIIDTLSRPTSVNEQYYDFKDYVLFPNPTNGIIKAKYNEGVDRIRILNCIGVLVKEIDAKNAITVNIDLSPFAQGIYFVEFINKVNHVVSHKKVLLE